YSTTGVILNNVTANKQELRVKIKKEKGVNYRVQFIGTLRGFDSTSKPMGDANAHVSRSYSNEIGQVLLETTKNPAVYHFTGKELYIRAKIISDEKHPNPFRKGDVETAWTQPVAP
ncbi:MAG: hypothetical protein KAI63_00815, partial [Planctomycetes bacterium]|nr:hypothetical protein [Planctomycetota bacterium]